MAHCIIFNYGRCVATRSIVGRVPSGKNEWAKTRERVVASLYSEGHLPGDQGPSSQGLTGQVPNSQTVFCHLVIKFARARLRWISFAAPESRRHSSVRGLVIRRARVRAPSSPSRSKTMRHWPLSSSVAVIEDYELIMMNWCGENSWFLPIFQYYWVFCTLTWIQSF